MKKNSPKDYYLYLIAKSISSIIRFVPINLSISLGRVIGAICFYFFSKKKRIAYKNIKIAFPNYSCRQINRVLKKSFMNQVQHFMELFYLQWMDDKYINKYIEFEGLNETLNLLKNKKGAIFLGLHEGSWEVGGKAISKFVKEYNHTILFREQPEVPLLNKLLNKFREKGGCKVIAITDDLRFLISHLKNGFSLAMATDHGGQEGILVDFFNRPVLTPTGAVRLALKLDANLIVGFIKCTGGPHHKIFLTPQQLMKTGDVDNDVKINLENIHRKYESYIEQVPEEYLWFFKRWKYSPQRNVLILSDGKAGHLKQSLALLDLIKELPFQIVSEVVEIKSKGLLGKILFQLCGLFFSKRCQGCMRCLRGLFGIEESRKLLSKAYDVVISCGSNLAILNRLIAYENLAKSIVILKPGMFSLKRFDLVIVPEHDNAPHFKNVVFIKGALSKQMQENRGQQIEEIIKRFSLNKPLIPHPIIGLLLGGSNRYLCLEQQIVKGIIDSLNMFADKNNGSILASTSRRTSKLVENIVKEELADNPKCRMSIIANEFNPAGSVEAIFSLSDILIISADSISMVSEALNSGKYTVVFKLKRKIPFLLTKHERFIKNLEDGSYVHVVNCDNLVNKLQDIWQYKPSKKSLNDKGVVLERLKKIL